jgi:hypothetical protein
LVRPRALGRHGRQPGRTGGQPESEPRPRRPPVRASGRRANEPARETEA